MNKMEYEGGTAGVRMADPQSHVRERGAAGAEDPQSLVRERGAAGAEGPQSLVRDTGSVCPVCLRKLPAQLVRKEAVTGIFLEKTCPEHGSWSVPVWRDQVDFEDWTARELPLTEEEKKHCSGDCRDCSGHLKGSCCVLLEITKRCNLKCRFCFAEGGQNGSDDPSFEKVCGQIDQILRLAGKPLIQFSGGEPTMRDDLPDLVRYAKEKGCAYTQVNTNGLRLGQDEAYVKALAEAGLDICFLQFDGTKTEIYETLRFKRRADGSSCCCGDGQKSPAAELLELKLRAIELCGRYGIGVTLVPTVVRGVNDQNLGEILRFAVQQSPFVKGIHFQPVTYLGRYPDLPGAEERYTLDELIRNLCEQTGLTENRFLPSACDHALCGFHGSFFVGNEGQLVPMSDRNLKQKKEDTTPEENRRFVGSRWSGEKGDALQSTGSGHGPETEKTCCCCGPEPITEIPPLVIEENKGRMELDELLDRMKHYSFTISSMAFQDALNLNLERLCRCSLHVYSEGKLLPFCGHYLTGLCDENIR